MGLPVRKWKASPNFSARHGRVDLIVLHDTEGGYAGAIATFMQSHGNRVSAHYVLREDGAEVTQMVHDADKAWHACYYNSRSIGIEMAGFASKGFGAGELDAAASLTAFLLHYHQIPCQWARGGTGPGFCRHYDLGKLGGGHTDPTTDPVKWQSFCDLVKAKYNEASFPVSWGEDTAPHAH